MRTLLTKGQVIKHPQVERELSVQLQVLKNLLKDLLKVRSSKNT